jgi:hypothetical protein
MVMKKDHCFKHGNFLQLIGENGENIIVSYRLICSISAQPSYELILMWLVSLVTM